MVGIRAMNSFDDSASARSSGSTMKNRSMILRASAIRSATRRFYGGGQQRHGALVTARRTRRKLRIRSVP